MKSKTTPTNIIVRIAPMISNVPAVRKSCSPDLSARMLKHFLNFIAIRRKKTKAVKSTKMNTNKPNRAAIPGPAAILLNMLLITEPKRPIERAIIPMIP